MMWAYIRYEDNTGRWVKIPRREDFPTKVGYQRRLSLTESINQLMPPMPVPPDLADRRLRRGFLDDIPVPQLDASFQHREPTWYSKRILTSYAHHLAHAYPHPDDDPSKKVDGIRIYRVQHNILRPKEIAQHKDPQDDTTYLPYFQGEFDTEGNLKDPNDPYLYWLIPILADTRGKVVHDYVEVHARMKSVVPEKPAEDAPVDGGK
jgi:hypothetical protein